MHGVAVYVDKIMVSIHAPVRGRPADIALAGRLELFQSTPP